MSAAALLEDPRVRSGLDESLGGKKMLIIARMDLIDANIHIDVVLTDAFQVSLLFSAAIISAWCT